MRVYISAGATKHPHNINPQPSHSMMDTYKIIADEKKLEAFIDWLPQNSKTERFYVALFARKKYDPNLKSTATDKRQLSRFTATKGQLLDKIAQLEIPLGRYKLKDGEVTQESLALYITPNPRCLVKANKKLLSVMTETIINGNVLYSPHNEAISCVQRSKSYNYVVDFDIDDKDADVYNTLSSILPSNCYEVVRTRGGFHILVYPKVAKLYNPKWHLQIRDAFDVDQFGDQVLPVVGCYQGGYVPNFL